MSLPHDVVDLQLAPVALALDKELQMLGALAGAELDRHILIAANRGAEALTVRAEREKLLVHALVQGLDLHGWEVSLDARGLRMAHRDRSLVLGLSPSLQRFLDAAATGER